ncbi:MAG: extracellular solute-binding protein, partial [Lachnospiraceae bacterium]|nr:extracellular solute-binding protein [Lachnospiraceae bacterium]
YNQNDYDRLRQGAKDGNPLMMTIFVANFLTVKYQENLYFQEETTIKGWPSSGGNGIRFFSAGYFSIVKPSKNPDGAWEFLKYILDNNTSPHNTMLPVNLSLLHEFAEDEYNRWSDNNVIQIGDTIVDGYSRADTDKLIELCKSVSTLDRSNPVITRIIDEEIGIYLNGQKSADEVINIIENRINIYLAVQD